MAFMAEFALKSIVATLVREEEELACFLATGMADGTNVLRACGRMLAIMAVRRVREILIGLSFLQSPNIII
jgi:hypothetical protein